MHVYTDGTVHLNHGGTEMGQGLFIKVAQIVADEFGVPLDRVQHHRDHDGKVPNTSPTAASTGTDLNGKAAQAAAATIKQRMADFAAGRMGCRARARSRFAEDRVAPAATTMNFASSPSWRTWRASRFPPPASTSTPKIHCDRATMRGKPFFYFAYGAAVARSRSIP